MSTPKALPQVIKARTLLKIVGGIAFLLPFILVIFAFLLEDPIVFRSSISHYYYSYVSVAFIGCLSAVSMVFFAYVGYDQDSEELLNAKHIHKLSDRNLATIIAILAAFVAIFPTTPDKLKLDDTEKLISLIHFISAAGFLLLLSYMAINRFTRSSRTFVELKGTMKEKRNRIYRISGWVMVASVVGMGIYFIATKDASKDKIDYGIFIGETICFLAFGVAWSVKGNLILKE